MNEITFPNNSWLSCFSSECIRNSTLKNQNLFFLELTLREKSKDQQHASFSPLEGTLQLSLPSNAVLICSLTCDVTSV